MELCRCPPNWLSPAGKKSWRFAAGKSRRLLEGINGFMTDALQTTLRDLATWLRSESIPFAVIGGIAASVRGEPRFTADVDLVVGIDVDQALLLSERLPTSPFRPLFDGIAEVIQTAFLMPIRHVVTTIPADIAIGLSGFELQAISRATLTAMGDFQVPVVTAEDLILMKLLASRPRDLEDIDRIVMRHRQSLDWTYLIETGQQLQEAVAQDLVPALEALRSGKLRSGS